MFTTKDSKTAAYLIYKGKDLVTMRKDGFGDFEFLFDEGGDIDGLVREFPLTPIKRYLDVYKAVIQAVKEGLND